MKIYDISQEVFSCNVFPGDPSPKREIRMGIANGDVCNLTAFQMCAHNGTHVDAPYHFIENGNRIDEIPLHKLVGPAFVADFEGTLSAQDAIDILERAGKAHSIAAKKILLKGKTTVSLEAAKIFADTGIDLIGNESQTVGPEDAPKAVHMVLLGAEVVLLEGIRLQNIPEGVYLLNAAPINLGGSDGAPCRALLIEQ